MSVYRVEIPGWHPALINALNRNRWAASRLKGHDRHIVSMATWANPIPRATGKRKVGLTIVLGSGQRAGDADAYWKSLLDALVRVGWLVDDRPQCVELMPVAFCYAEYPATIIELEDLDGCESLWPPRPVPSSPSGGTADSLRSGSSSPTRTPRGVASRSCRTGRTASGRRGKAT